MGDPETENVGSGIFDFFSRIPKIVDFRKKFNFFRKLKILGAREKKSKIPLPTFSVSGSPITFGTIFRVFGGDLANL